MVEIIRLHDDPHKQTQTLLAWYANGSLEPGEAAAVEAHLAECAECRADLKLEHIIGGMVSDLPMDTDQGWAALRDRVERQPARREAAPVRLAPASLLRRPASVGWALAASLVLGIGLGWYGTAQTNKPVYRALGSAPAAADANMVVVFKPTTTEQQLRTVLVDHGARLVGGPTASDAYILHVAPGARDDIVARLRIDSHVVLAEPIDEASRP